MNDLRAIIPPMKSFDPFPVLETSRLVLRQLVPEDVTVVHRNAIDPLVGRYLGRDPDGSIEVTQKRLQYVFDAQKDYTGIRWGITRRDDPTLMGTVGFWKWNKEHFYAEIGYEIGSAYWNKGYMTEAIHAALGYGFEHMDLHRVEANIDPANTGSRRVLEKVGFVHEATLRQNWYYGGVFLDSFIYGLLKDEYKR